MVSGCFWSWCFVECDITLCVCNKDVCWVVFGVSWQPFTGTELKVRVLEMSPETKRALWLCSPFTECSDMVTWWVSSGKVLSAVTVMLCSGWAPWHGCLHVATSLSPLLTLGCAPDSWQAPAYPRLNSVISHTLLSRILSGERNECVCNHLVSQWCRGMCIVMV